MYSASSRARQSLGVLLALILRPGKARARRVERSIGEPDQPRAGREQHERDDKRGSELLELRPGEPHGSLRASTTVKRGASPVSVGAPMSPVRVPSEVMSKGSWVRTSS